MPSQMHFGGGDASGGVGLTSLLKEGYRHFSGVEEAIVRNINACRELTNITRSSLGPNGMNKLVINHLEKLFVTSDAATICRELELNHPAAKLLVMAGQTQQSEKGDNSNFVVTFAGELLSNAEELLRTGVHPSDILLGFKRAYAEVEQILPTLVVHSITDIRDRDALATALKPVIASKQHGHEDYLAPLVAQACTSIIPPPPKRASINADSVRVAKMLGGTLADSQVIKGLVVQRPAEGAVTRVTKAKIAVFGSGIETASTETKGTVLIESADELKSYNKSEETRMEDVIKSIAESGAKVVVAGGAISEIAQHFLDKYELMTIKILSKFELRRLCQAVGASALVRLGAPTPDELGWIDVATVEEIGGRRVAVFRQEDEDSGMATLILRGSTQEVLDDIERAVDDAVAVAKQLAKDGRLLPGAAATEMELAHRLAQVGDSTPGLEQYAIHKFAEALEFVARVLSENSGQDATEVVSALYSAHAAGNANAGVDIDGGADGTLDAKDAAIVDSFTCKQQALRLAVDAALTVLRVDQIIVARGAGGPKPRQGGPPGM